MFDEIDTRTTSPVGSSTKEDLEFKFRHNLLETLAKS